MLTDFLKKVEVKDIQHISFALRVDQLSEKRLKEELDWDSWVFPQHNAKIFQNNLPHFGLLVVLNE